MPSTTTVQGVIDQARVRHPAFADATMPDGALLLFLNQRQRSLLLQYHDHLGPLVSTSVWVATTIDGMLVGSEGGVPVYLTTFEDGWPVFKDTNGVPYFDFTGPKVAGDPFGENGGTLGFPLPDNFVALRAVTATYTNGFTGPIDVIPERARHEHAQGRNPAVFIAGNRMIPVLPTVTLPPSNVSRAEWVDVYTVEMSYVALDTLTSLTDVLTLPDAVADVLVADVAALLALRTPGLSAAEKAMYKSEAVEAAARLAEGRDMIGDVSTSQVLYMGPG